MNDDRLNEIEKLLSETAPGPWTACTASDGNCKCGLVWSRKLDIPIVYCMGKEKDYTITNSEQSANMKFIAEAKTLVPELIAEIKRLQGLLDRATAF